MLETLFLETKLDLVGLGGKKKGKKKAFPLSEENFSALLN